MKPRIQYAKTKDGVSIALSRIGGGLARTSSGVAFDDRGEQSLKAAGEPVWVWAVEEG